MTTEPEDRPASEGHPSRRHVVQALAAGAAAASVAAPARAQSAAATMAEASPADYVRDPTRWGSPEVAALFPGFKHLDLRTKGAVIRLRHGGSGPPLLLLHGFPQNHVCWHRIAARLAERYHVVLPDLRGYGDSSLPEPGPNHINYSFRAMAEDMIEVMEELGHRRFFLAGHDRGARTSFRLCLDHPERVEKVCLMDVLPNYHVWTNTTKDWALSTWHWLFLPQPEPFPETMISAVPPEWFLANRGGNLDSRPRAVSDEFIRCFTPKTIYGSCRDYRAGATIDFEMDSADKDRPLETPALILWGVRGRPPERDREFRETWPRYARNIVAAEGLPCGHYIQEEVPDVLYDRFVDFFRT